MPDPVASEPEIEFEAAMAELERIVEGLERGGPDLKRALDGYGRGVALLGHCQGILDKAERSVALLTGVDDAGQPIRSPFDATATTPPASVPTPAPPSPRKSSPAPSGGAVPEAPF